MAANWINEYPDWKYVSHAGPVFWYEKEGFTLKYDQSTQETKICDNAGTLFRGRISTQQEAEMLFKLIRI